MPKSTSLSRIHRDLKHEAVQGWRRELFATRAIWSRYDGAPARNLHQLFMVRPELNDPPVGPAPHVICGCLRRLSIRPDNNMSKRGRHSADDAPSTAARRMLGATHQSGHSDRHPRLVQRCRGAFLGLDPRAFYQPSGGRIRALSWRSSFTESRGTHPRRPHHQCRSSCLSIGMHRKERN
jgi:hypothetical protein